MINQSVYQFANEFYVVEKTVELVVDIGGKSKTIRIEALHHPPSGKYHTRAYERESFNIQPTYPQQNGQFTRQPEDRLFWVDFDLPWTDRNSADDAITQAIGFLQSKCD